jgi:hypothetical protein
MQFDKMKQIHDVISRVLPNEVGLCETLTAEQDALLREGNTHSSFQYIYFGNTNHESLSCLDKST